MNPNSIYRYMYVTGRNGSNEIDKNNSSNESFSKCTFPCTLCKAPEVMLCITRQPLRSSNNEINGGTAKKQLQ